jgi:hypothetical protein
MNATEISRLDERALRKDLNGARFLLGMRDGRWREAASVDWPYAYIAVSAAQRDNAPLEYTFRFECSGYPKGITASLWDIDVKALPPTTRWPTGRSRLPLAFRPDWKGGTCLYLPCDRVSIEGHEA